MRKTTVLFLIVPLLVSAALAQPPAELPIAALVDGDVWLYGVDGAFRQLTVVLGDDRYDRVAWSPDGRLLAFAGWITGRGEGLSLLVSNLSGQPSVQLATNLHPYLPISFAPDAESVVYGLTTPDSAIAEVYRYATSAGSGYSFLGAIPVTPGCGADSAPLLPSAAAYAREVGSDAAPRYTLALTPFGLLYRTDCADPAVHLLNTNTGQSARLLAASDGLFVAPDGSRAVAVTGDMLTFIASEQGPYTQIVPVEVPDQVGFGAGGDIFYSTRRVVAETALPDGVRPLLEAAYFQMPVDYEVTLRRFNLRTGVDEEVYRAPAYGIGRIAGTADGLSVVFSQVPNPGAWVEAVAGGQVQAGDPEAALPYAAVEVYALSLPSGEARLLGRGWEGFALHPAAVVDGPPAPVLSPVPPTLTPIPPPATATLPPTLTPFPPGYAPPTPSPDGFDVGAELMVTRNVGALNVRERPGTGERVVQLIYAGDRVTLLGGPQDDAEGFRWWQVRLRGGAEGWVAEQVNGVRTLERN